MQPTYRYLLFPLQHYMDLKLLEQHKTTKWMLASYMYEASACCIPTSDFLQLDPATARTLPFPETSMLTGLRSRLYMSSSLYLTTNDSRFRVHFFECTQTQILLDSVSACFPCHCPRPVANLRKISMSIVIMRMFRLTFGGLKDLE